MTTILVIDDDPALRSLAVRMLRVMHYQTLEAGTGEAGVRIALEEYPDVVAIDIAMPGLDGYQTCQQLRERGYTAPIFLMSNISTFVEPEKLVACGADGHLEKPILRAALQAALAALVSH